MSDSTTSGPAINAPDVKTPRRVPVRVYASLVHMGISLCVAAILVVVVFFIWYPSPYATLTGVTGIFLMMLGIDVTLGPFITLIIFNPKKKSLRFDLTCVAIVQLCALAYGGYAVFIARPAYIVYNVDRFDMVLANDVERSSAAKAENAQFRSIPVTGPVVVYAKMPTDSAERSKVTMSAVIGGSDLPQMPQYYFPYSAGSDEVKKHLKPLAQLREKNPKADPGELKRLARYADRDNELGYVPLRGKVGDCAVIIDRQTGAIVDMLALNPW